MAGNGTTATVTMELPIEVFSALRRSTEQFAMEMRLAAEIHWYSRREMFSATAARRSNGEATARRCTAPPVDLDAK